jgi:hypothetical protein
VLYIAGSGRSGSTLLDRLIGMDPAFHSGGEITWYWEKGVLENQLCSCGASFADCPFWIAVRTSAPNLADRSRAESIRSFDNRHIRGRWLSLFSSYGRKRVLDKLPGCYREQVRSLYKVMSRASNAEVVVDSSKDPRYLFLLSQIPGIDLRAIHLVRDPRGVVNSWRRHRVIDPAGRGALPRSRAAATLSRWSVANPLVTRLLAILDVPHLLVRYEDLVAEPGRLLDQIRNFAVDQPRTGAFDDPGERTGKRFVIGHDHLLSGNPIRFHRGEIEVRLDEEWRTTLDRYRQLLIGAAVFPLLKRYGYDL